MNPYEDGYYAGLVNDRSNPHAFWDPSCVAWHLGNRAGLTVHCAIVEYVYVNSQED